ncbi:hypothetical protein [Pseudomonas costantinii]|uniref:Uncharacterized protein n=1 Tax=Pseudomonas costantinii TaxID=168469 RepID=A0A1S2UDK4_9PSED|nr:hypothetical protein [Pseudomonas costantinii]OIN44501.1 hypothetical protein BFL40_29885 [Pseudomonas costantinii]SED26200.1 hypothetical protein SAMN04515675_0470 [Pseudomonas costantinii]
MDRQTVYPGQILPETALLQMTKDAMIGSAKLAAAVLGTSTIANGFAVTPTGPASLQVVVAPGEIYALTNIDSLAFSTLPADTTHSIMKQGILLDGVTLSCPAPTTTGQSINYLIQATYQDQDTNPVLLPYYNSANPAMPFSGMGNNGQTQNTSRKGVAVIQVKAGASAASGSQATPAPDSGYVGLYAVTVANGQTIITSANITQYLGAPLLPSGILQSIQSGNMSFAIDTGTAGAYVGAFSPAFTARSEGQIIRLKAKTGNSGASTINDGVSTVALVGGAHAALQGGEIIANGDMWAQWNSSVGGGSYILLFCTGAPEQVAPATQTGHAVTAGQIQAQALTAFTAGGTAPAFTLTPTPAISAYAPNQGFRVTFGAAGGATPTLNVSAVGPKNLKQYNSTGAKIAAVIVSGQTSDVFYDGTDLVLLDQLPNSNGVTQAQFDNSLSLATTAFVQGVGFQYRDMIYLSGATTLTAAAHAGTVLIGLSNSAFNVQLPAASSMPAKATLTFWNYFPGTITLVCAGSDGIFAPGSSATFQIPSGMSFTLVSNGGTSWYAIGTQNTVGVIGAARNLTGSATGLNAVATFAADEIVVENSFNSYQVLRAMSISPSLANPIGANGLDTGSVGGAVSTWYSVWVIWNGSTVSGLFSLSATSPTMPAGYTHKALVGWARTDATGSKFLLGMTWIGARWSWKVAAGTNLAAMPIMASGSVGSITTPTWIAVPWASFAPPTAKRITVVSSNGSGTTIVAPNNSYGSSTSTTNPSPVQNSAGTAQLSWLADLILESSNIYWASNAAGAGLFASGGEI